MSKQLLVTQDSSSDGESLNSQDNALCDFFNSCPTDAEDEMVDSMPLKKVVGLTNAKTSLMALAELTMNMGLDKSKSSADYIFHLGHIFEPSEEDRKKNDLVTFFSNNFKEGIHGFNKCIDDLLRQENTEVCYVFAQPQDEDDDCKKMIVAAMAHTTFDEGLFVHLIAVTDQKFVDVVSSVHNSQDREKVKKILEDNNTMQNHGFGCFLAFTNVTFRNVV